VRGIQRDRIDEHVASSTISPASFLPVLDAPGLFADSVSA
jgi:hypothetical protein